MMAKFELDNFLSLKELNSEDEILSTIKKRVEELYYSNPSDLMQHLYRLDVSEFYLEKSVAEKNFSILAQAIWERQKGKMKNWNQGEIS